LVRDWHITYDLIVVSKVRDCRTVRSTPPWRASGNRRYLVVAARSGEGLFTGPLRTHSSHFANRYFVEFTAYARAA